MIICPRRPLRFAGDSNITVGNEGAMKTAWLVPAQRTKRRFRQVRAARRVWGGALETRPAPRGLPQVLQGRAAGARHALTRPRQRPSSLALPYMLQGRMPRCYLL